MIAMEVGHLSSISGLPYHYFLSTPTAVPPSGESLKSSEARLVRKIGRAQLHLGEGWEEVMRVALRARRDARAELRTAETIWQDTETRNEATRTDAVVKLHTQGIIDDELAWEMLGLSPAQIERIQERMAKAEEEAEAEQAEAPPAPPAAPPEVVPAPTGPRMGATVPNA
jgi:hypothetical protein